MGKKFKKHKEEMIRIGDSEEITLSEFAFYLKTVRESLKLTHEEMANITNLPVMRLKHYESGSVEPDDGFAVVQSIREYIRTNVRKVNPQKE